MLVMTVWVGNTDNIVRIPYFIDDEIWPEDLCDFFPDI